MHASGGDAHASVDTTLFYSPTSGGVRRYLNAKHHWYLQRGVWRHTLLVHGARTVLCPGDISTIAGLRVPGTFNYRLHWRHGAGRHCSNPSSQT
jgi:alpha-1,6-mannosyltransferase